MSACRCSFVDVRYVLCVACWCRGRCLCFRFVCRVFCVLCVACCRGVLFVVCGFGCLVVVARFVFFKEKSVWSCLVCRLLFCVVACGNCLLFAV